MNEVLMWLGAAVLLIIIMPPVFAVLGIISSRIGATAIITRWVDFWVEWELRNKR